MKNVVNFQNTLNKITQDQHQEENICPHCEDKSYAMEAFLEELFITQESKGKITIDDIMENASILYDISHENGKNDGLSNVMGYAQHLMDEDYQDED